MRNYKLRDLVHEYLVLELSAYINRAYETHPSLLLTDGTEFPDANNEAVAKNQFRRRALSQADVGLLNRCNTWAIQMARDIPFD